MKNHTRREFLERIVCGMGAGVVFMSFDPELLAAPPLGNDKRGYTAARWLVELEGTPVGPVESVQGGNMAQQGGNVNKVGRAQKGPSNIKYEEITIVCGTGLARNFYEWIGSACSGRNARKSGAISAGDFNYKEISRTEWTGAIISEVAFPALDASSKEAAHMTIRISPEGIRWVKGSGRDLRSGIHKQAKWQASNFRLNIPGVDCRHVSKIDSLTIQNGPRHSFSNLVATLSEADTATWVEWENSQRKRGAGQGGGKSGRLDYLVPDMREVLFSLTFQNLQLTQLATKGSSPRASVHNAKATMSFQGMIFSYSNAA